MICLVKEVKINGEWECIGIVYESKSQTLWPALVKQGMTMTTRNIFSNATQMFIKFYQPRQVRQYNVDSILKVRDLWPEFDKVVGCWPFDHIDFVRYPADLEAMYRSFGATDYRLVAWRE